MNPLGLKAGILAAAAFVLLVPTFNALNAAHFEEVDPPFNLEPPDDPPDVDDPPMGDQDLELNGVPPPGNAGACEEFDVEDREAWSDEFQASPSASSIIGAGGQGAEEEIEIGPNVIGLALAWGVESYMGQFQIALEAPTGKTVYTESPESQTGTPISDGDQFAVEAPQPGTWIVRWSSEQEISGGGAMSLGVREAKCRVPEAAE